MTAPTRTQHDVVRRPSANEAAPCPFCGGPAHEQQLLTLYSISCGGKDCQIKPSTWMFPSSTAARAAWNRRRAPSSHEEDQ